MFYTNREFLRVTLCTMLKVTWEEINLKKTAIEGINMISESDIIQALHKLSIERNSKKVKNHQ